MISKPPLEDTSYSRLASALRVEIGQRVVQVANFGPVRSGIGRTGEVVAYHKAKSCVRFDREGHILQKWLPNKILEIEQEEPYRQEDVVQALRVAAAHISHISIKSAKPSTDKTVYFVWYKTHRHFHGMCSCKWNRDMSLDELVHSLLAALEHVCQ